MSIVKIYDIGERCLKAIWDMMKSQSQVIDQTSRKVLKSELTECWNDDFIKIWPWRVPHRVFLVLKELVLDTNGNAILHMLFDKVFPSWIKVYLKQIKHKKREVREAHWETFDAIFELLSVSIDGNE